MKSFGLILACYGVRSKWRVLKKKNHFLFYESIIYSGVNLLPNQITTPESIYSQLHNYYLLYIVVVYITYI